MQLFLVAALVASATATCDVSKLSTCGNTFLSALGITTKLSGTDFILYTQKLIKDNGVAGIVNTCTATQGLVKCMGDGAMECFTLQNLEKGFAISQEDAIQYTYQITGMLYTCVDNPTPFATQIACIAKVSQDSFDDLHTCTESFFSNTAKDPMNVCKYMEDYKSCSVPYYKSCGGDLQNSLCTGMAKQASAVYPGCTWSCSYSAPASFVQTSGCDQDKLKSCGTALMNGFGLSTSTSGKDFVEFITKMVATQGVDGIKAVCAATAGLDSCLGDSAGKCATSDLMAAFGLGETDAAIYVFQLSGMEYTCLSAAAPVFLKNIQCIADVSKSKFDGLTKCLTDLYNSVSSNPSGACDAFAAYSACTVPQYAQCGSELQGALCKGEQVQAQAVLPTCTSVTCSSTSAALVQGVQACDQSLLKSCGESFMESFGLTTSTPGQDFVATITKLVADNGVAGIQQVCASTQKLVTCMGDQANACLTVANLMSAFGVSSEDATIYEFQITGMAFTCDSAATPVFLKNIQCIADVSKNNYNTLLQCLTTLYDSIKANPTSACDALKTYKSCAVPEYSTCSSDLQGAFCQGVQAQASSIAAGCDVGCSSTSTLRNKYIETIPAVSSCDQSLLKTCGESFMESFGLTTSTPGTDFVTTITKLVADKGVAGIQQVCASTQKLVSCMGDQATACLTVANLMSAFGVSEEDATVYEFQITGMAFTCDSAATPVFLKNIQCVADVSKNDYDTLYQCLGTLYNSIKANPSGACDALKAYKTCTVPEYATCGSDLQGAFCQGLQAQAASIAPGCDVGWSSTAHLRNAFVQAASCDQSLLKSCGETFMESFGLSTSTSGRDFVDAITKLVATKGVAGIQQTCGATQKIVSCMGDQADACLTVANLMSAFGVSDEDATIYEFQITGMAYTCASPATPVFEKNIQCVADVSKNDYDTLMQCLNTLYTSVKSNPAGACDALKTYKSCTVPEYASCGGDLQGAFCQGLQAQAASVVPGCDIGC